MTAASSTCRCGRPARRSSSGSGPPCARCPFGHTVTYGEIARRVGVDPRTTSRAVGTANGSNPIPVVIPCHRVIGANGTLTGFAGGLGRKQVLLTLEQDTLF